MILSYTRKFLFVHIYRTGGTSVFYALAKDHDVRVALRNTPQERWPAELRTVGINPEVLNLEVHTSALKLREVLGAPMYDSLFKFAFVRNPWDHVLSHYLFVITHPGLPNFAELSLYPSFRDYVLDRYKPGEVSAPQRSLVADESGKLIVDFVGRYENLAEDFKTICARIGLADVALSSSNETEHKPWMLYYDRAMFDCVAAALKPDIDIFGYNADPAAYGIARGGIGEIYA